MPYCNHKHYVHMSTIRPAVGPSRATLRFGPTSAFQKKAFGVASPFHPSRGLRILSVASLHTYSSEYLKHIRHKIVPL
jgi:hypothetical protein